MPPVQSSPSFDDVDDDLGIEVTFEPDEEPSGVQLRPVAAAPARAEPASYLPNAEVVLLIEDEPLMRRHIVLALMKRYTIYEATDGADALAMLARMPRPACIVSDVNMPRMTGIEFARMAKVLPNLRGVPVVFLSSSNDPRTVCDAINAGAKHFVSKRDSPEKILAKVEKIVGGASR
jgi:two-component system chemotaxis response regulator CheY